MKKRGMQVVIAGLILSIFNFSAYADSKRKPTLEERRNECAQNPDKIFVESTRECIPINPCKSDLEDIREDYCMSTDLYIWPGAEDAIERFVSEEYSQPEEKLREDDGKDRGKGWIGYMDEEGDYITIEYKHLNNTPGVKFYTGNAVSLACWAHGQPSFGCDESGDGQLKDENDDRRVAKKPQFTKDYGYTGFEQGCFCRSVKSQKKCKEIAEYASSLRGTTCVGKLKGEELCLIKCELGQCNGDSCSAPDNSPYTALNEGWAEDTGNLNNVPMPSRSPQDDGSTSSPDKPKSGSNIPQTKYTSKVKAKLDMMKRAAQSEDMAL